MDDDEPGESVRLDATDETPRKAAECALVAEEPGEEAWGV
jgi:hypothetical protein